MEGCHSALDRLSAAASSLYPPWPGLARTLDLAIIEMVPARELTLWYASQPAHSVAATTMEVRMASWRR